MKKIEILKNEELKNYSTIKIGGKADIICIVHNSKQLIKMSQFYHKNHIKYKVIGLGANLLFSDLGYRGAIIVNRSNKIKIKGNLVSVESGVTMGNLIKKCIENNLSGLENLSGIPSTIGGAITNNLGAFDATFSNTIKSVTAYEKDNPTKKVILSNKDCLFAYRDSLFKHKNLIITKCVLLLKSDKKENILSRAKTAINKKITTQPMDKLSLGSVFKRNNEIPAKIIDELGLKGFSIGDASISTKHAGFIVNNGSATQKDVLVLIDYINTKAKNERNVEFEKEIEIVEP